ncbi:hypothetical protein [Eubacterium sp.]
MKKSFKKVVAILLAVMMIVCSVPLTVFAADDANRANINLQFGDVSCTTTKKTVIKPRSAKMTDYLTYSGLNSDKLTYSNGKIDGYNTGDFFTVSVLLENVTELSAAEVAIKYSEAIEPAYIKNYKGRGDNVEVAYMYNEATPEGPHADFPINEAIPTQSGNALYNSTSTLGETSYVDPEARIMHANFAVQTGANSVSLTDSKAVLATFMFKIVNDKPITFSIDNTQSDPYETYTLGTIANGGKVEEYKTYAKVSEADVPALDFMGENEYNGTIGKNYTITFVDADGQQISSTEYKEGTAIIAPSLPATTHDADQHYTYAWDKAIPETATASDTYTIIKTGAAHTWDEGVVTTEPTTEATGVKTYTCTFDGCGATKTETLPKKEDAHVHTWSEWKYNGDAEYVSKKDYKDGTVTRTCTDPNCPEHATETKTVAGTAFLRANTFSLVLDNSLTINFKITKANVASFSNIKLKAQTKFKGEILFDEPTKTDAASMQYLVGMPPQYVKDDIDVVAYSTVNIDGQEVEVYGPTYSRSILYYANGIFKNANYTGPNASAKNKATKIMCVDILNYASATQKRMNYEVNDLANAALTEEQKSWATPDIKSFNTVKNYVAQPNPNRTARFTTAALALDDAVIPKMKFALKAGTVNLEDITIEAKVGGDIYRYNPIDNDKNFAAEKSNVNGQLGKENRYYFYFTNLLANQMFETIEFRIYANGQLISDVCTYSVESYVQQAYPINGQLDKDVYMTMLKYGTAAYNYGKA